MVRRMFPTEIISQTGKFITAAYYLNDTVATMLKEYHELIDAEHHAVAEAFNELSFKVKTHPLTPGAPI
jgi:hypothetical protein